MTNMDKFTVVSAGKALKVAIVDPLEGLSEITNGMGYISSLGPWSDSDPYSASSEDVETIIDKNGNDTGQLPEKMSKITYLSCWMHGDHMVSENYVKPCCDRAEKVTYKHEIPASFDELEYSKNLATMGTNHGRKTMPTIAPDMALGRVAPKGTDTRVNRYTRASAISYSAQAGTVELVEVTDEKGKVHQVPKAMPLRMISRPNESIQFQADMAGMRDTLTLTSKKGYVAKTAKTARQGKGLAPMTNAAMVAECRAKKTDNEKKVARAKDAARKKAARAKKRQAVIASIGA